MRKIAILLLLTLLAVLAIPVVSATEYYLLPDDSSATYGTAPGNCTNVSVWLNATEGVYTGMFNLTFDANCAEITSYTLNYTCFNQYQVPVIVPGRLTCGYEYLDGATNPALSPCTPGHVHLGNFTICCNTTSPPCQTNLEFNTGTGVWNLGGAISFTVDNGTFACNAPPAPDIIVDRIDPKYVFADLNNRLLVKLTNQGGVDATDFNVSIVITNDTSTVLYSKDIVIPLLENSTSTLGPCSTDALHLGWWMPDTPLENITINVTAYNVAGESNTGNNQKVEHRNTTLPLPDCVNDTMLPDTCYGYRGQHPLTENYHGTGKVIYVDNSTSKACITHFTIGPNGDTNYVNGEPANIPVGSSVKSARLYVYYGYRNVATSPNQGPDPRPDFNMTFEGSGESGILTADSYYTDIKGFAGSNSQYGTLVYNVTANVTGNGSYTARRYDHVADPHDKKGYAYAMALMVIYDCDSYGCDSYSIAHGYDRIATQYWGYSRWQYFVNTTNATTTATLSDVNVSNVTEAKLFTVAIDTTNGTGTDAEFQSVNTGLWDDAAWSKDGRYLSFDRSDVTSDMTPPGTAEVVHFREGYLCGWGNGFGAVFACLTTRGENTSVHTAPAADKQCYVTFDVDKGCIENLTALNVSDAYPEINDSVYPVYTSGLDHGLFALNITCLEPGETVYVTIKLCSPPGSYVKYNTTSLEWDDEVPCTIDPPNNTIVVELTDGGHYDLDNTVDGQITDPGGALGAAVQVNIAPCPVDIYVGIQKTVNISLSNIADYGSGTIHLYYDKDMLKPTSVGNGDSNQTTTCPVDINSCNGYMEISAHSDIGLDAPVAFAHVTFMTAPGATRGCTYLKLTVETLYDRNYTALPTVVNNCTDVCIVETNDPYIVPCPTANPCKILTDTGRARVQFGNCTNITNLTVQVTDDSGVKAVYVNLTPILGGGGVHDMVKMDGPAAGATDGVWYWETNASNSSPIPSAWNPTPHILNVMAVDIHDTNWNNDSNFELTTLKRGDVSGTPKGSEVPPDDIVDNLDYYFIAKYTVGLEPPAIMDTTDRRCRGEIVALNGAADSWNGIDMADALYIAMYEVSKEPLAP